MVEIHIDFSFLLILNIYLKKIISTIVSRIVCNTQKTPGCTTNPHRSTYIWVTRNSGYHTVGNMPFQEGLPGTECVWTLSGQDEQPWHVTHLSSSIDVNGRIAIMSECTHFFFLTCKRVKRVEKCLYNPSSWIIPAPFNGLTQNSEPNGQFCAGYFF